MSKFTNHEQQMISATLNVIHKKLSEENGLALPVEIENYLRIRLACDKDEWLCVMFMNNQYRMIRFERLFRGPVSASSNLVKVVARKAIELNAAVIVLAQYDPLGSAEPNDEDRSIREEIKAAMAIFDIHLLDHIKLSPSDCYSTAQHELL